MKTLLKDMPEHAERIENNFSLKSTIKEIIQDAEIMPDDKYDKHPVYEINDTSADLLADQIFAIITDFVNQNYTWKGVAK